MLALALAMLMLPGPSWANLDSSASPEQTDEFVFADGVKLHFVVSGSGKPVILLHGNDGTLNDFTMSIFGALSRRYKTIAFDRPGHGESGAPEHMVATPEVQARLLHTALRKMGVVRPLLVAHSWSGSLALSYALQFPNELSGIVTLGAMAYETKEAKPKTTYYAMQVPVINAFLGRIYKAAGRTSIENQLDEAFAPDAVPQSYKEKFLSLLFRMSQMKAAASDEITLNPCLKHMSPDYPKINVPVIIVVGSEDKTVPPSEHSYPLHKAILNSKLIVLQNAGHELQFTRPTEVIKAIDMAAYNSPVPETIAIKP